MPARHRPAFAAAALLALLLPLASHAAGVSVRLDLSSPDTAPFPSDRFTVRDWSQNTFRRVALPKPDCAVRPSDCEDIDVINQLDGFSTQPRITVPFTGPIDPASVTSDNVFLVSLGDTLSFQGFGRNVGIDQVLWDPATNTLVFEPERLLDEHTRYVLVVTDGVRDAQGKRLKPGGFAAALGLDDDEDDERRGKGPKATRHGPDADDRDTGDYRRDLRDASRLRHGGHGRVVAASLFTTQSSSADLAKIVRQIKRATPKPADFMVGLSDGQPVRALFDVAGLAGIRFDRQVGAAPSFSTSFLPTPALGVVPGAVAQIAYGRFESPDYQTPDKYIPATATATLAGQPEPQGRNELTLQLFVPAGAKPAGGWPVALFGHGFTDSVYGAPWAVASVFASRGIATLSINVVGHGGGPQGALTVLRRAGAPVVVNAGGRGIDQDGDGDIEPTEGVDAAPPRSIIGSRDGLRQTVIDLMQLVRQVEVGLDVDGDGSADLDARRIYYAGQSFGGIYGTMLLGVEPALQAGVPNVPGGSITEVARLGGFRPLTGIALATRVPSLINVGGASGIEFNENIPLRGQPTVVNTVPGALAIQQVLDRNEWVQQSGNPVSYAAFIRKDPLHGNAPKPVILQFAKGDQTVPNPTSTAIVRAGDLAAHTTYFRNDLAYAANPAVPRNPHTFLTNVGSPAVAPLAIGAQLQIATFFATNGTTVIDPDGPGLLFEVPIVPPLPEGLNFIPAPAP